SRRARPGRLEDFFFGWFATDEPNRARRRRPRRWFGLPRPGRGRGRSILSSLDGSPGIGRRLARLVLQGLIAHGIVGDVLEQQILDAAQARSRLFHEGGGKADALRHGEGALV